MTVRPKLNFVIKRISSCASATLFVASLLIICPFTRAQVSSSLVATSGPSNDGLPDAPSTTIQTALPATQSVDDLPIDQQPHPPVTLKSLPKNILYDGGHIAISPIYLRTRDLKWLVPLAGAAAAGFETDHKAMTEVVSSNPSFNNTNKTVSDGLRDGLMAAPILLFASGQISGNDHARETGILATEAYADAFVVDEVVKLATFRERPLANAHQGNFFVANAGVDSAFVSGHTMIAWASAAAIAEEYHSPWVRIGVYTAATGVALTRVLAQQHFPTDVLLGGAGGWLIGHYVVRAHHHSDLKRRSIHTY